MSNIVQILVKGKDESGKAISEADKSTDKLGKTHAEAAKKVKLMAAAGALLAVKLGKDAVGAASNLGESINAVQTVFGPFSKQMLDQSKTAEKYGLSQRAFNEAITPLGALLKNSGMGLKDVSKHTLDLTKRAADMASVFNTSVPDALEAIQAGLRGEADPLEKYGVSLSQAKIEAEAMAEGLGHATKSVSAIHMAQERASLAQTKYNTAVEKYGKGSTQARQAALGLEGAQNAVNKASAGGAVKFSAQELATARLNLILKQTSSTNGDFARTSGGLANSQRIVAAQYENAQAQLGKKLLPMMLTATKVAAKLIDVFSRYQGVLLPLAGAIGVIVLAVKAWKAAQILLNLAITANPIGIVVVALAAIATSLYIAYSRSETFRTVVIKVFSVVKVATLSFVAAWIKVQIVVLNVFSAIVHGAAAAFGWMPGIGGKLKSARKAFDDFRKTADKALHGIQAEIKTEKARQKARDFAAYLKRLGATPVTFDLYTRTHAQRPGTHSQNASGGVFRGRHYASGGAGGGTGMINDGGGPEIVRLPDGSMVYPAGQSADMASRWGRRDPIVLEIRSGGSKLDDLLVELIRRSIRIRGGNVQAVLGAG
jgi:phage-related protein